MITKADRRLRPWVPALRCALVCLNHMASWDPGSQCSLLACQRHQGFQASQPDSAKGVWVGATARGSAGALGRVGPVKSQPAPHHCLLPQLLGVSLWG